MFGEKAALITELSGKVNALQGQLDEIEPFIDDAKAISNRVSELVQHPESINYTASQIAQLAFETIRNQRIGEARDQLVREYIAGREDVLYKKVLDTVREQEGSQILENVQTRMETDADFMTTIQDRARQTVWQEAVDRMAEMERASVEEALLLEEERRTFFNKLNVQYRFDGEMRLDDEELLHYLKHGDRLRLDLLSSNYPDAPVVLEMMWREESEKVQGWSPESTSAHVYMADSDQGNAHQILSAPGQRITPIHAVGGTGTWLYGVIKDQTPIVLQYSKEQRYFIRIADHTHRGRAIVTNCQLLPRFIPAIDRGATFQNS